jgi:hypothetical protein
MTPALCTVCVQVTGPPDFLKHSVTARVNGDLTSMTPTDFSRGYVAPKEPKPRHTPTAGTSFRYELAISEGCAAFSYPQNMTSYFGEKSLTSGL